MSSTNDNTKKTLKIVGTVALVGALATLGLVNVTGNDMPMSTFLKQDIDGEEILAFNKFISTHHKSYLTKAEYNARLANFKATYDFVKQHDAKKEGSSVAINAFADYSEEEIRNRLGGLQVPEEDEDDGSTPEDTNEEPVLGAPTSIDWRA